MSVDELMDCFAEAARREALKIGLAYKARYDILSKQSVDLYTYKMVPTLPEFAGQ